MASLDHCWSGWKITWMKGNSLQPWTRCNLIQQQCLMEFHRVQNWAWPFSHYSPTIYHLLLFQVRYIIVHRQHNDLLYWWDSRCGSHTLKQGIKWGLQMVFEQLFILPSKKKWGYADMQKNCTWTSGPCASSWLNSQFSSGLQLHNCLAWQLTIDSPGYNTHWNLKGVLLKG